LHPALPAEENIIFAYLAPFSHNVLHMVTAYNLPEEIAPHKSHLG